MINFDRYMICLELCQSTEERNRVQDVSKRSNQFVTSLGIRQRQSPLVTNLDDLKTRIMIVLTSVEEDTLRGIWDKLNPQNWVHLFETPCRELLASTEGQSSFIIRIRWSSNWSSPG